eukprot:Rhum_TRINITY_DN15098_c2_g1::Rhum_TRINITY_DN15098_c2_g1_i1::g.132891::m.132891
MMSRVLALSCAALAAAQNTCDPYTMQAEKPANAPTKSQDYCYNAGTCEWGEFKATPCAADPCQTNECKTGYTCKSSYCGGCNWQCVKEDPCTRVRCANCRADPVTNEPICGSTTTATKCESNDDCGKDEFCRQDQDAASQSCLKTMTCVKKHDVGGKCSGRVEPCFTAMCRSGLICLTGMTGVDGGTCVEQVGSKPTCKSDDDCEENEFCRQKVGGTGISPCLEEKMCVKKSNVGEKCSGKVLPCQTAMCRSGLVCKNDDPTIADAGGLCVEEVVAPKPCTPYQDAMCIAQAGVCYNPKECKCGQYPKSVCKTNSCNADSCKDGYECRESGCGGCSFQCVKKDVPPTCKEGSTWKKDCNTCSCSNGRVLCTEMACGPVNAACKSDADCSRDEFCRQKQGTGNRGSPCLEERQCVKKADIGETCSGFMPACFANRCREGLMCKMEMDKNIADAPGVCREEVVAECKEGKKWQKDCNTCGCEGGMVFCTEMDCQNPDKEKEKEKEKAKKECVTALKEKTLKGNQKKMCCRAFAVGCGDAANVCFDTSKRPTLVARRACCWDHRQWCMNDDCEDKGVCPLDELRQTIKEEAPRLARRLAGKLLKKLRTRLENVDVSELKFNPKKFVARVRRTLLKASATLRKDPSRLIVRALKGKDVQVDVPLKWNDDMVPLEEDLTFDAAVVSRAAAAQQAAPVDGFTVDYIVDDKAVPEIEKAAAAGVAADGSTQTMAIKAGTKTEVVEDEDEEDDETAIWPIVLGSVLGATCIGGVALLTVYKRKESNELTDFQQMAAAEELHGNAAGGEEMTNCKL